METQIFIRCHQCRELKGCDMGIDGVKSCFVRGCTAKQKQECIKKMQVSITTNDEEFFTNKCVICAYKFAKKHRFSFSSDE